MTKARPSKQTAGTGSEKTAVLLAGGLGSRLRPYTLTIPKPLLPLAERPIIEIVIKQLADAGFTRVIVSIGHLGDLLRAYLKDGSTFGTSIEYVEEDRPLGTAGCLRLIPDLPEHFLVMNGDILTTLRYTEFMTDVFDSGAAAGVAMSQRIVTIDYGVLKTDEKSMLADYGEKPVLEYNVSMGVYALTRSCIGLMPDTRYDMPDLLSALIVQGSAVRCYPFDGYWKDIGRIDDFEAANRDFGDNPLRFLGSQ